MGATNNSRGRDYERLVAAIFRSDGQLVERNRRTPEGATEMDLLAWRPDRRRLTATLVECKCGQDPPAATDLLVLKGRQCLIGADRAVLVSATPLGQAAEARDISHRLGITLADGGNAEDIKCKLRRFAVVAAPDSTLVEHWCRVFEVEDACRAMLQTEARRARQAGSTGAGIVRARDYLDSLDALWWRRGDPWTRAVDSYRLHKKYRLVAQDVAWEYRAAGGGDSRWRHLRAVVAEGWCPPAQAVLYVQTRARMMLALLAAQCCFDLKEDRERRDAFFTRAIPSPAHQIPEGLPRSFRRLVERLYQRPGSALSFPILLQTWETGWGGFLTVSNRREEEETIAAEVSVSRRDVSYALNRLNELLTAVNPFAGPQAEWFAVIPTRSGHEEWQVKTLKLLPEPWKGLGLARRQLTPACQQPTPWPKYYDRWLRQVAAYTRYVGQSERGNRPSWQSVEREVCSRVRSSDPFP